MDEDAGCCRHGHLVTGGRASSAILLPRASWRVASELDVWRDPKAAPTGQTSRGAATAPSTLCA
jgi:hypothetical protein